MFDQLARPFRVIRNPPDVRRLFSPRFIRDTRFQILELPIDSTFFFFFFSFFSFSSSTVIRVAREKERESGFQDYTWTREMGDIFFFSGDERARKSRLKASVSNFYRRWRRIFYGRGQCKIKKRRLHPSDSADNKGGYARYRRLTPRTPYAPLHRRTLAHHPGCETTI